MGRAPGARRRASGIPTTLVDEAWHPIASEQLERQRAGAPLTHHLVELPGVSRRSRRLLEAAGRAGGRRLVTRSSAEDDGAVAVDHARGRPGALDRAREHDPLDVPAEADHRLRVLAVGDARDVLLDDRAGVELLRRSARWRR